MVLFGQERKISNLVTLTGQSVEKSDILKYTLEAFKRKNSAKAGQTIR